MNRLTAFLALSAAAVFSSSAEVNPADYPDLELGKQYPLVSMKAFRGKYTATTDGQIIEHSAIPVYILTDNALIPLTEEDGYTYAGYMNGQQTFQFPVTAGTTYFFEDILVFDDGYFSITMNTGVEFTGSYPAVDNVYDPAEYASIEVSFNQNVSIGKAVLTIGELSAEVETLTMGGIAFSTVSILINDVLRQWYNEDKIEGNQVLTITLSDIKDGQGKSVDELALTYKTANKPVELKSAVLPAEIMSWYAGESGKAVFTFSGAMAQNPDITLCYAPVELGYEYIEKLDAKVEDNVITVDFGGVLRTSENMSTSGRTDPQIYLQMVCLRDAQGQVVWADGEGSVGTFLYEIPFVEIPRLNITSEFTPSQGASLENTTAVKIYFNCTEHLTYTGVCFQSGGEKAVVPMAEITVDQISDNEVELTVPVPEGWNTKSNVTISLDGLATDDGYDHTSDISAKFNGFTLLYCSLKDGAVMKSLAEGTIVKVETNLKDDAKLTFEIAGLFGPVEMTASGAGVYMLTMPTTVVFESGETYTVNFTATPGGVESLTIKGDTTPYEFSDIELNSIIPGEGSTITSDTEIKVTFSGLVSLSPVAGSAEFTAVENGDEEPGYGFEWTLKVEKVTDGPIVIAFAAMDMDGKVVKGNEGVDAESYFKYTFNGSESSIGEIVTAKSGVTYDLQGRQVLAPAKGIFIRDGKKIRL